MNNFNKGFTLIELLVVVLVIGALTSVALPQYERAVLRSRAAEVWTVLPSLRSATEEYCMANGGYYAPSLDELSVEIPPDAQKFNIYTDSCYSLSRGYGKIYAQFPYDKKGGYVTLGLDMSGGKSCTESVSRDSEISTCRKLGFENGYKSCGSGNSCSWSYTE